MRTTDSFIVGYDSHDDGNTVLIVGKKSKGEAVSIVNAFQGDEAKELYKRLTTKKEK